MGRINLKKFRIDLNLKAKEIAKKTNISSSHYSNIENGINDPKWDYMNLFAETFNVDDKDVWVLFKKV